MRGDTRSNREQDSSSGSSSPHSSTSRDDEILEVSPPGFMPKPIYNFSIPDVIKHEPRVERHENNERLDCDITNSNSSLRKRSHPTRNTQDNLTQENDIPISVRRKKRRRVEAAENIIGADDDDCHRPPVIDLTDSHDEYTNAHSDSEVNDSSHIETRPLHHTTPRPSFNEVLSNLQRFRQQLEESHERVHLLRSGRLHRLRRCINSRAIITDGPLVTDDMLVQSPEPDILVTPEMTSADDSVMVINEVRGDPDMYMDDHDIALRMANDPTYSPPYAYRSNPSNEVYHPRYTRTDESFHQFQERIRCIRQRSRDRLDQVRRMSQQAQARLARIHDSINSLHSRHGRRPLESIPDPTETNSENENREGYEETANTEVNNDDVEIIRESNPRTATINYLEPPLNSLSPLAAFPMRSLHTANGRQPLPLPDFLRTSLMNTILSPIPPPRLHHLHDVPEGYEVLWNLAERLGPAKPRGLNKQEIDQIPSFRFSATTARETNTKCVVCIGEYSNREKLRRLPCTHDFHSKCIDKWLRSNKTCPVCRDEVKIDTNKPYTP